MRTMKRSEVNPLGVPITPNSTQISGPSINHARSGTVGMIIGPGTADIWIDAVYDGASKVQAMIKIGPFLECDDKRTLRGTPIVPTESCPRTFHKQAFHDQYEFVELWNPLTLLDAIMSLETPISGGCRFDPLQLVDRA